MEQGLTPIYLGDKEPPLHFTLDQLMQIYYVPGLSVAVIDNFKIDWAKAYGVAEPGSSVPITVHTLFQAGPVSESVAAVGTLSLVERGKISLDENVNSKLKSWQVPATEFTKDQPVTLRRILSHSAGFNVQAFPGYDTGSRLPTLLQVLDGKPPANTAPIRVDSVPGSKFRRSGGGLAVEQQLVTDVTGQPFAEFMRETVLDKIGMSDSTFEQPLSAAHASVAATATHFDGQIVKGKWHIYPETAAAGLWTTPTDLAKFAIEIAKSKQGTANHVLSQGMTRELVRPELENMGLGVFVGQYGDLEEFGHSASNEGFRAVMIMFADSGKGIVIMTNSENVMEGARRLATFLIQSVAKEYAWNYTSEQPLAADLLQLIANARGSDAVIRKYLELKKAGSASPYILNQDSLIDPAYHLLSRGHTDGAIALFELEAKEYPAYWNAFDSLGEAYLKAGKKELAEQAYHKSVELNPQNEDGTEVLKRLQGQN